MDLLRKILILLMLIFGGWPLSSTRAADTGHVSDSKDSLCLKCHNGDRSVLSFYQTKHGIRGDARTPHCQSCHGESISHLEDKKISPDVVFKKGSFSMSDTKIMNANCLTCHDKEANRHNWTGSKHEVAKLACVSCHSIHNEHDKVRDRHTQTEVCFTCHKEQRAQEQKISHHPIAEGKVTCSDCHNLHGSAGPKLLKENTVNDTCFTCHAEKRGPFLWEHLPVTENCSNCHTVHGSNIAPLLKSRPPFLCQQCHNGPSHSLAPVAGNAAGKQGGLTGNPDPNNTGRACLNCHSMVHGSNHPAGALLHR